LTSVYLRDHPEPHFSREAAIHGTGNTLFGHAQVLHTAQRAGNLAEYDRLMGMYAVAGDGPYLVAAIEDLLRAATAGDRATAERMLTDIIAGRG
jgi:hypothetical protein